LKDNNKDNTENKENKEEEEIYYAIIANLQWSSKEIFQYTYVLNVRPKIGKQVYKYKHNNRVRGINSTACNKVIGKSFLKF
jgi:hypothetical protein